MPPVRRPFGALTLTLLCASTALHAQQAPGPSAADVTRSSGLRRAWQDLTREVAWPAHWTADGRRFVYRKTVAGGFAFEMVDADTLAKTPAFDAARLATALGAARHETVNPLHLPFAEVTFTDDGTAITFTLDETGWRCGIVDYRCAAEAATEHRRPRGFGLVRDLSVPADNSPKPSPVGQWTALVQGDNLVVRRGDAPAVRLSSDGSAGDFYDPETLRWSPDGRHIMIFRVRPGYQRHVLRVEAAPPGQIQPGLQSQLYPKLAMRSTRSSRCCSTSPTAARR
jgi:hypothetical protein